MNLSLYLLLAAENEPESEGRSCDVAAQPSAQPALRRFTGPASNDANRWPGAVYEPSRAAGKFLPQASYRQPLSAGNSPRHLGSLDLGSPRSGSLGFAATVLANAVGFLLMTSGLLVLLQIAEVSLG